MSLAIETFNNVTGGVSFFKAVGHPMVADRARALMAEIAAAGSVAIYDPNGLANAFAEIHDCSALPVVGSFVQDITKIGQPVLGRVAAPVTDLAAAKAKAVFIIAFDSERLEQHIRHLVPAGMRVFSLDAMRLDDALLTNRRRYLDPINFATNFAFFRDAAGQHTRLVTANYWAGYGAEGTSIWFALLDDGGREVARWHLPLEHGVHSIVVDSAEVRQRFGLGEFTGQLFLHVINAAGHDIVKYALDTYGDDAGALSCTHDANAWPSDLYGGLPAPDAGEQVLLWIQNSHPCPIPRRAVGLNRMGSGEIAWLDREIPPFGTYALDVGRLLPGLAWPDQIEINAGKHFVRPRYEVVRRGGRRRMAHAALRCRRRCRRRRPRSRSRRSATTATAGRWRGTASAACRGTTPRPWTPTGC
jgi:hypothetical protein